VKKIIAIATFLVLSTPIFAHATTIGEQVTSFTDVITSDFSSGPTIKYNGTQINPDAAALTTAIGTMGTAYASTTVYILNPPASWTVSVRNSTTGQSCNELSKQDLGSGFWNIDCKMTSGVITAGNTIQVQIRTSSFSSMTFYGDEDTLIPFYQMRNDNIPFDPDSIINQLTRIITTVPYDEQSIATGTIRLSATFFISPEDFATNTKITIYANYLDSLDGDIYHSENATTSGYSGITLTTETTATILSGQWNARTEIIKPKWDFYGITFGSTLLAGTSTTFITGVLSAYQQMVKDNMDAYNDFIASSTITYSLEACNPISGFDPLKCVTNLFLPTGQDLQTLFSSLQNGALNRFPFGYATRFIEIFTASTSASIPIMSATIPTGIVGGGSTFTLDINHSLDSILYAKATDSSFGTSSSTFYETTSYYWNIIVYLALGLYILRRLLGAHLIPHFGQGTKTAKT